MRMIILILVFRRYKRQVTGNFCSFVLFTHDCDLHALIEGVEMTRRNLDSTLDRHGLTRIDPLGEKFDHNFHEAMFEVETVKTEPGTVVQVIQRGYRIHDRLLRPARVGIAKRPPGGGGFDTEA